MKTIFIYIIIILCLLLLFFTIYFIDKKLREFKEKNGIEIVHPPITIRPRPPMPDDEELQQIERNIIRSLNIDSILNETTPQITSTITPVNNITPYLSPSRYTYENTNSTINNRNNNDNIIHITTTQRPNRASITRRRNLSNNIARTIVQSIIHATLIDDLANYDLRDDNPQRAANGQFLNDDENSHDSYVVESVKKIITKLRDQHNMLIDFTGNLRVWLQLYHPEKLPRIEFIMNRDNFDVSVVPYNISPHHAINLVYQHATRDGGEGLLERLAIILSDDETYHDGMGRCPTGIINRIISAVDTGEDVSYSIGSQQFLKESALGMLARIRDESNGDTDRARLMADERLGDNEYYVRNRDMLIDSL